MRLCIVLALVALVGGCGTPPESDTSISSNPAQDPNRFTVTYYKRYTTQQQCAIHIITDKTTECQYLQVCNSVTVMPNTCKADK